MNANPHSRPWLALLAVPCAVALFASCRADDGNTGFGGGSSSGGGDDPSTTGSSTTTGSTSTTGTTTTGAGGAPGAGGGGQGGDPGCPDILITDAEQVECDDPGAFAMDHADVTDCTTDFGEYWPVKVYEVTVAEGDCLSFRADNPGAPDGVDLFGAIVDPSGASLLFDDEVDCAVPATADELCPSGGTTVEASGTAYVMVGTWGGDPCGDGETTPFTLAVAINGDDVDVSGGEVCAGDLHVIIP